MKNLTVIAFLLPSAALAHGGHPPVAEAAHSGFHAAWAILPLVVLAIVLRKRIWRAGK